MKIKVLENVQEVSSWVIQQIRFKIPNIKTVGLATGQTMIPIYNEWIRDFKQKPYALDHLKWFLLDELLGLPPNHPDLYQTFLEVNLLNSLNVKSSNCYFPNSNTTPLESAKDYEDKILSYEGLDLQLLGIGGNGHIGLNEPGTEMNSLTHITQIAKKTQDHHHKFAQDKMITPTQALTQGYETIKKHRSLFLIATGESKAEVMKKFFDLKKPDLDFPASIIKDHTGLLVIMDKSAAKLVK